MVVEVYRRGLAIRIARRTAAWRRKAWAEHHARMPGRRGRLPPVPAPKLEPEPWFTRQAPVELAPSAPDAADIAEMPPQRAAVARLLLKAG